MGDPGVKMRVKVLVAATVLAAAGIAAAAEDPGMAKIDIGRLPHSVWLGPGCDGIVEMDQLFETVGTAIEQAGVRARDKMDRVELQCAGAVTEDRRGLHAYLTAEIMITRKVRYGKNIGRLILIRDMRTIELDGQVEEALREPLRGAVREIIKQPLADYVQGKFPEITPAP